MQIRLLISLLTGYCGLSEGLWGKPELFQVRGVGYQPTPIDEVPVVQSLYSDHSLNDLYG